MEYGKKDWQRSGGRLKSLGRESQRKEKPLSAYRPADREKAKEQRPNEMMTMESSFGGISLGASRRRRMTMVVHEKRRARGPGLKQDNKELEGNRTASLSELRGSFRTNSHSRRDSAFAYEEELGETPLRMMERLQEMMDENSQRSGEQVLYFLDRKAAERERREIVENLRESQEKNDQSGYALWNRRQEAFRQEEAEKAEQRRSLYRELSFTREKSRRLMREDVPLLTGILEEMQKIEEDGGEAPPEERGKQHGLHAGAEKEAGDADREGRGF